MRSEVEGSSLGVDPGHGAELLQGYAGVEVQRGGVAAAAQERSARRSRAAVVLELGGDSGVKGRCRYRGRPGR